MTNELRLCDVIALLTNALNDGEDTPNDAQNGQGEGWGDGDEPRQRK